MSHCVPKKTHTKLTIPRKLKWTLVLASAGMTLAMVSCSLPSGQKQDSVPTVSPTLPLTVASQESIKTDWQSTIEAAYKAEYEVEAEAGRHSYEAYLMMQSQEPEVVAKYSSDESTMAAQTVWGEARGCSRDEQKLVIWCICNRADAFNQSIEEVITAPYQFAGYSPSNPVDPEIVEVVEEVFQAWSRGEEALVLPPYSTTSNYKFFGGDGEHNWFREEY